MSKETVIRTLLRTYPAAWRSEYGDELAQVLTLGPLTPKTVGDVAINGIWQRVRYAEAWQLCGAGMALWLTFGTALNSISPLPQWAYGRFFLLNSLIELAIGYTYVSRRSKGLFSAALAASKASLIGVVPELLLTLLWTANLVHPTILNYAGTAPSTFGHGITELCLRTETKTSPVDLLLVVPLNVFLSLGFGLVGGAIAKGVPACRSLFRIAR